MQIDENTLFGRKKISWELKLSYLKAWFNIFPEYRDRLIIIEDHIKMSLSLFQMAK